MKINFNHNNQCRFWQHTHKIGKISYQKSFHLILWAICDIFMTKKYLNKLIWRKHQPIRIKRKKIKHQRRTHTKYQNKIKNEGKICKLQQIDKLTRSRFSDAYWFSRIDLNQKYTIPYIGTFKHFSFFSGYHKLIGKTCKIEKKYI